MSGRLNINNEGALLKAALADGGIAIVPSYSAIEHIENRRLSVILPNCVFPRQPVSIGYPDRRQLSVRTRTFVDFLVREVPRSSALRDAPVIE
jgi:DNA-binding transcriptional LysR family regulator